jgi:hypothetical protein
MEYVDLNIKVPKEACEALDAVIDLVACIKKESEDGFDITDLTPIMRKAIVAVSEISDFQAIMDETKKDPEAMAKLIGLFAAGIVQTLGIV